MSTSPRIEPPPPPPRPVEGPPSSGPTAVPVPAAVASLRAEADATTDKSRQAAVQYEIGHVVERETGLEAQAVREYLGAYNLDPAFRPPLFSLVRVFERRRSFKNLARLYEAELKSATTGEERASALLDRAALVADHLGQPEGELALLEQACDEDGDSGAAALVLEWRLRRAGAEPERIAEAVAMRAARTRDPVLRALLLVEVSGEKERMGDVDGAMDALRAASRLPGDRPRFLRELERAARRLERPLELVAALESRAAILLSAEGRNAASEAEAIALYVDAARARLARLGDAEGARGTIDKAIALAPEDLVLVREHMLACEALGDTAGAAADAQRVLAAGVEGRHAAPLRFRLAEAAQVEGDAGAALEELRAAEDAAPGSAVVRAMLEDATLAAGLVERFVADLDAEAEKVDGDARQALLFRAALMAAHDLGSWDKAAPLFTRAHDAAPRDRIAILRERLGAATALGAPTKDVVKSARALLAAAIDDAEKSVVLREIWVAERARGDEAGAASAKGVLLEALALPAALDWAADAARLVGAETSDALLLTVGHRALADRAREAEVAAAHLCAAARASCRSGEPDAAVDALRAALQKAPGQRYAVTLLEEIYRKKGDADAVVRVLREAAEGDTSGRAMQAQLLVAGAAAESAGDRALAERTYLDAHERDPMTLGPILALRRLAESKNDRALLFRMLERLAERETEAGTPGRANLELGEELLLAGRGTDAVAPLRAALDGAETRMPAALALTFTPDAAARVEGARALADLTNGSPTLLTDLLALATAAGDVEEADRAADALLKADPADRSALLFQVGKAAPGSSARAAALFALADATSDGASAAELTVQGMHAATLAGEGEDGILRAAEVEARAPGSLEAALAYVEALGDADDPSERADALARLAPHLPGPEGGTLRGAWGRALLAAGRSEEALVVLRARVEEDPEDLASWEALRVAARDERDGVSIVRACDVLAEKLDGELRAQLLEEAAVLLMDATDDDEGVEQRLRAAMVIDPARPIAYSRLHDLLADRNDDAALLELVLARIDVIDDPEALTPLFYEEARLRRVLGQRDEALAALESLFLLEPEHVGGLALLVELHVQREAWAEAVDALRSLAKADVPAAQKRIARLGAADFLERKLGDSEGALVELKALEQLGLADRPIRERIATIAEKLGLLDQAAAALAAAAEGAADPGERAALHRRRAELQLEKLGDRGEAAAAYRQALAAAPLDVTAAEALAKLSPSEARDVGRRLEEYARAALAPDPTEPELLRTLYRAAVLAGDGPLQRVVVLALAGMRAATPDELRLAAPTMPARPTGSLSDAGLGRLRIDDAGPVRELALLAVETLTDMDRLEPATFGVGRAELVRGASDADVVALATAFGAAPAELYLGGKDPQATLGFAYRGKPLWIIGTGAQASPARARFHAAQYALGMRLGLSPLAWRAVTEGADAVADALLAVALGAGATLPAAAGRVRVAELAQATAKAMSRRVRKAAPEVAAQIPDGGRAVVTWARALRMTLLRAGALAAADPGLALDVLCGSTRDEERTRASTEARELVRFWISGSASQVRSELGLGT